MADQHDGHTISVDPLPGTRGHIRTWQVHHARLGMCWAYEVQLDDDPFGEKAGGFKVSESVARSVAAGILAAARRGA